MAPRENDTWAFGDWWSLLNTELADRGESEALYADAATTIPQTIRRSARQALSAKSAESTQNPNNPRGTQR